MAASRSTARRSRLAAINVTARRRDPHRRQAPAAEGGARLWRYHKPDGPGGQPQGPARARRRCSTSCASNCRASSPSAGSTSIREGLLLLTNDGELARLLELPATGWIRRYRVRAYGKVDDRRRWPGSRTASRSRACTMGRSRRRSTRCRATMCWLTFAIREGKNREVKKVCEHLGLKVNRLIRTTFGPFAARRSGARRHRGSAAESVAGAARQENSGGGDADRRRKVQRP